MASKGQMLFGSILGCELLISYAAILPLSGRLVDVKCF